MLADEHGQHDHGASPRTWPAPAALLTRRPTRSGADPGIWHYGYLFAQALTIGGGTGDVQRNIIAERVLGLPHDIDVEVGLTWAEARRS